MIEEAIVLSGNISSNQAGLGCIRKQAERVNENKSSHHGICLRSLEPWVPALNAYKMMGCGLGVGSRHKLFLSQAAFDQIFITVSEKYTTLNTITITFLDCELLFQCPELYLHGFHFCGMTSPLKSITGSSQPWDVLLCLQSYTQFVIHSTEAADGPRSLRLSKFKPKTQMK